MSQTAIQRVDRKTGRKGSFFYDSSAPLVATSPVMPDLVTLYTWEKQQNNTEVIS